MTVITKINTVYDKNARKLKSFIFIFLFQYRFNDTRNPEMGHMCQDIFVTFPDSNSSVLTWPNS